MEKLLSFSVAAYNIEAYLDQLMQSIIDCGRMPQIEVLIVDDASTDRTAELASAYQTEYPDSVRYGALKAFLADQADYEHA